MLRLSLSLIVLACAALAAPANARPPLAGSLVQLDVVDRDVGRWLPQYHHRGDTWIAGAPGHRYAVRLRNNSAERVLVVLSVDGVNAVSGETADPQQAGYVLAPWQSTEIAGWRKSLDDVAQFVFTDLPDSYAARTGRPDNVGVLGIAVFREARPLYRDAPPPPIADAPGRAERASAPTAAAESAAGMAADKSVASQRLGTGHGEREWAPVSRTGFERASRHPDQVSTIRYDDADRLLAMGVLPQPAYRQRHAGTPRAFPAGFVADPPPRW